MSHTPVKAVRCLLKAVSTASTALTRRATCSLFERALRAQVAMGCRPEAGAFAPPNLQKVQTLAYMAQCRPGVTIPK